MYHEWQQYHPYQLLLQSSTRRCPALDASYSSIFTFVAPPIVRGMHDAFLSAMHTDILELPAVALRVAGNLDRIADSLSGLLRGTMPLAVAEATIRAAERDVIAGLFTVAARWALLDPTLPSGVGRPEWPRVWARPLAPGDAATWVREVPALVGHVARDWAAGWRSWSEACEALLEQLCQEQAS
jgi:hypothetical protein